MKELRREVRDMQELVADLALENRVLKKSMIADGRRRMRYPASEKLEIIRIVEKSHLPVRQTLSKLGIPRATFYRWYDLFRLGGIDALADHRPLLGHAWNRGPDKIRRKIVDMALDIPELSPGELAVRFTDTKRYFVSESSVYRLLKAHDLITSPAFTVMKAADEFKDKGSVRNLVCGAIMKKAKGACYGDQERSFG